MAEIVDLSALSPDPVIVRIGNGEDIQEIDLTIVPAVLTLSTSAKIQKYGSFDKIPDEETIEIVAEVCGAKNPAITADWLKNSCTKAQLTLLTTVVYTQMFRPPDGVKKRGRGAGDPKNP